ncbi:MAG: hypothetical protein ACRCSP_00485 [Rhodoglobus sp.]
MASAVNVPSRRSIDVTAGGMGRSYYEQVNIVAFIVSLALFIAGLYIMGLAFYAEGAELFVFLAGILCSCFAVFISIHILKRIDG